MTRGTKAPQARYDRRTVLKASVAAASAAAVGTVPATATTNTSANADASLESWLSNVGNFDGIVDERGKSEVTVEVGAQGNDGAFGFGPAVVRVDPGTTVVWEWTGGGGSHNVVAKDGSYESKMQGTQGATFEFTFDAEGVSPYYCAPHEPMGMKGAVVVGDLEVEVPETNAAASGDGDAANENGESSEDVDYDGWFDNVSNFDGTVDRTGESKMTIEVGADGNNGSYAFDPPAVHVDTGTTVVWEWTGDGGSHNVVSKDGSYESKLLGNEGETFEFTFEDAGISKYYCAPHEPMGMKGAIVVGNPESAPAGAIDASNDAASGDGGDGGDGGDDLWLYGLVGGLATALLSPILFGAFHWADDDAESDSGKRHGPGNH